MKQASVEREPKTEFAILIRNSCYYNVAQQILARIPEEYLTL